MAQKNEVLYGDEWREALAASFNGLVPDGAVRHAPAAEGWLSAAQLGDVAVFHVAGRSQAARRLALRGHRVPARRADRVTPVHRRGDLPAAVAELSLDAGSQVWLTVKATDLEVYPHPGTSI